MVGEAEVRTIGKDYIVGSSGTWGTCWKVQRKKNCMEALTLIQYAESACPHGPLHSKAKYSGMLMERLQAHLRGRTRQWHLHRMRHSHTPFFLTRHQGRSRAAESEGPVHLPKQVWWRYTSSADCNRYWLVDFRTDWRRSAWLSIPLMLKGYASD